MREKHEVAEREAESYDTYANVNILASVRRVYQRK